MASAPLPLPSRGTAAASISHLKLPSMHYNALLLPLHKSVPARPAA
jgi:hypothetical protein